MLHLNKIVFCRTLSLCESRDDDNNDINNNGNYNYKKLNDNDVFNNLDNNYDKNNNNINRFFVKGDV